jgi:TIR domain
MPALPKSYQLLPLTEEVIKDFLIKLKPMAGATRSGDEYARACDAFHAKVLAPDLPEENRSWARGILSNPMDLSVVAYLISQGKEPNLFRLYAQHYEAMAEGYRDRFGNPFPIAQVSEEAYQMRLEGQRTFPADHFVKELSVMADHKLAIRVPGEADRYQFRHQKVEDYFIVPTFLRDGNKLAIEHLKPKNDAAAHIEEVSGDRAHEMIELATKNGDAARFQGVYFLLAELLRPPQARLLINHLVEYGARTKDHSFSDEFIRIFAKRESHDDRPDDADARAPLRAATTSARFAAALGRPRVFVSYSAKDAKYLDEFRTFIKPRVREGDIFVWADTDLQTGETWRPKIEEQLASADVAVMLVSQHFVSSDFIQREEFPRLLERAQEGRLKIMPVFINYFTHDTALEQYQFANSLNGSPLVKMDEAGRAQTWVKLVEAIEAAVAIHPQKMT